MTNLIIHPPNLNYNHLNSYSVPSDLLEIGPKLTMDYPMDNPFWFVTVLDNKLVPWCACEWRSINSEIALWNYTMLCPNFWFRENDF